MWNRAITRSGVFLLITLAMLSSAAQGGKQKWDALIQGANPIHWYAFDEVAGTTDTADKGSGGLNGVYRSLVDLEQEGLFGPGEAVRFEAGGQEDVMWSQGGDLSSAEWTAEFIVNKMSDVVASMSDSSSHGIRLVGWGSEEEMGFVVYGVVDARFDAVGGADLVAPIGEWLHIAYRGTASVTELFLNGVRIGTTSITMSCPIDSFGGRAGGDSDGMDGFMDEAVIFDYAVTDEDILAHAQAPFLPDIGAIALQPEDGAVDVLRDVDLSWMSGTYAEKHDIYLGMSFDDVNDANPDSTAYLGRQDATTYDPGSLILGGTYYWRIDEVNALPDETVFKGDVWTFEVEPVSLPVSMDTVGVTASSMDPLQSPDNTVNGSGLSDDDTHANIIETMWLSDMGDAEPWIQFELDQLHKLDKVRVWNHNSQTEAILGFGVREALIETSLDGESWTALKTVELPQAAGFDDYLGAEVSLDGAVAQFVRLSPLSNYSLLGLPQKGLSEVRFYYIPNQARELDPADGSITDGADVTLSWRSGREAVEHEVYLGTDPDNLALLATTSESVHVADSLEYATTYNWQVVEVNEAETPARYEGALLSFATPPYAVIDDFEKYADEESLWIWSFWADGFENPDNGAIVGYGNIGERNILHGGAQSMPLQYNNNSAAISEATLEIDDQNWGASGIETLSLYFHGATGNTGQLYLKINDTQVLYDRDATDIAQTNWKAWNIDLSSVGTDLENVKQFSIGISGAGASGIVYIDDIRLYPQPLELFEPAAVQDWETAATLDAPAFIDTFAGDGLYDIGALSGEISYEFIVRSNPAEAEASMALIGRRNFGDTSVGLKFEQWPDSGTYGATVFGVADYDFEVATAPGDDTHLVFISSEVEATTSLYVNGAYQGSIDTAITLSGLVGIGFVADAEDGSASFDNFDGDIFGVAIYDVALSEDEIAAHADAFLN